MILFNSLFQFINHFVNLTPHAENDLAACCQRRKYPAGRIILEEGIKDNDPIFIENGLIRCFYYDDSGNENTYWTAPENYFYYPNAIRETAQNETAYLETIEDTTIIRIPSRMLEQFARHHPELQIFLRIVCEQQSHQWQARVKLLRIRSLSMRLQYFYSVFPEMSNRLPLKYIASYINVDVSTLSKLRKKERDGYK